MEHQEIKQQSRAIIDELLTYSFAQIFDILPAEQKLKDLSAQEPNAIEPLIGQTFTSIMLGNRDKALELSNKIWSIGGELSPFFELIYADCLINLGEEERAGILLADRFGYLADNLKHFYSVLVRCALLSGKLKVLTEIGEYPGIYEQEPIVFNFANDHAFDLSLKDYRAVLQILKENLSDCLCSFEYHMYPYKGLELLWYTSLDVPQNEARMRLIQQKIDGYFLSMHQPPLNDLLIKLVNIKLHPAWQNSDKDA